MKILPFKKERQTYQKEIEKIIREEMKNVVDNADIGMKVESPLLNQSSHVIRPDFLLKKEKETFIVETRDKIKPNDVSLVKGMVSGSDIKPILISREKTDNKTAKLADLLDIKLINGSPSEAATKLKEFIDEL